MIVTDSMFCVLLLTVNDEIKVGDTVETSTSLFTFVWMNLPRLLGIAWWMVRGNVTLLVTGKKAHKHDSDH